MKIKLLDEDLFDPPFTTEEMEHSRTECRCEYHISTMLFEDGISNYPTTVSGMVNDPERGWVKTGWNRFGKNTTQGKRIKQYDLVREGRKERAASVFVFFGFIGIVLFIIYNLYL